MSDVWFSTGPCDHRITTSVACVLCGARMSQARPHLGEVVALGCTVRMCPLVARVMGTRRLHAKPLAIRDYRIAVCHLHEHSDG
jgi:hypothetical protein